MTWLHDLSVLFGGAMGVKVVEKVSDFLRARTEASPAAGLKNTRAVYDEMHRILAETEIDRINIYRLENGGGKIVVGAPQYITCIYDVYGKGLSTDRYDFNRFPIDNAFTTAFNEACQTGLSVVNTHPQLPFDPASKIRDVMLDRGMKHVQFHFLAQTSNKCFFAELSSKVKKHDELEEKDVIAIRLGIERIRAKFKQGIKYLK